MTSPDFNLLATLRLATGDNLEALVEKIQNQVTSAILSVKNGTQLCIFSSREQIPVAVEYVGKKSETYYFRSVVDGAGYAVFGAQAASIFSPSLFKYDNVIASIDHNGVISTATTCIKERAEIRTTTIQL